MEPTMITPKNRAKRKETDPQTLTIGTDPVSGSPHRMQQSRRKTFIDLASQAADLNVDHIGLGIEVIVPDRFQQHGAGHDLTLMPNQIFEQAKFPGLQGDRLSAALHPTGPQIES